jgi:hypothetical protein
MIETNEVLTVDGIETNMVTRSDLVEAHGEPVAETDKSIVFADSQGQELNAFAEALNVSRSELSAHMHELARELTDYSWSVDDPVVIAKPIEE